MATTKTTVGRPFLPEKVGPKLRRYALAKAWDEIAAADKKYRLLRLTQTSPNQYAVGAKVDGHIITATSRTSYDDAEAKLRAKL